MPETDGTNDRIRSWYAVDVKILTPEGERGAYEAVSLPVLVGVGMESGMFAFPQAGAQI